MFLIIEEDTISDCYSVAYVGYLDKEEEAKAFVDAKNKEIKDALQRYWKYQEDLKEIKDNYPRFQYSGVIPKPPPTPYIPLTKEQIENQDLALSPYDKQYYKELNEYDKNKEKFIFESIGDCPRYPEDLNYYYEKIERLFL